MFQDECHFARFSPLGTLTNPGQLPANATRGANKVTTFHIARYDTAPRTPGKDNLINTGRTVALTRGVRFATRTTGCGYATQTRRIGVISEITTHSIYVKYEHEYGSVLAATHNRGKLHPGSVFERDGPDFEQLDINEDEQRRTRGGKED